MIFALTLFFAACENEALVGVQPDNYKAPKYLADSEWTVSSSNSEVKVIYSGQLKGAGANTKIKYAELIIAKYQDMSSVVASSSVSVVGTKVDGSVEFPPSGEAEYFAQVIIGRSENDYISSSVQSIKIGVPTITNEISDISWYSVTVKAEITTYGLPITERGIVFSCTSQEPAFGVSGRYLKLTGTDSSISRRLSVADAASEAGLDIENSPTFYIRAYATTAAGTGYGPVRTFKTVRWPSLTGESLTSTATSVTYNYNVTKASGDNTTITEGFYYGTSSSSVNTYVKGHTVSGLNPNTTYYFKYNISDSFGAGIIRIVPLSITTQSAVSLQAIDLGLPSGLKWADRNLGASKPEDYGDYYAWGETLPKSNYSWETYAFRSSGTGDEDVKFSKYNTKSERGPVDNKVELELSDDAAHVNWGGNWRLPTKDDWSELMDNCTWTWVTQNGVNGFRVRGSSAEIFLPAADMRLLDWEPSNNQDKGEYWSSSFYGDDPLGVWCLSITPSGKASVGGYRCYGRSIRPVCE